MVAARNKETKSNVNEPAPDTVDADIVQSTVFSENALRSLDSFEAAMALAQEVHGSLADAANELGDGFSLITDLKPFINVPVVILEWTFRDGDFGTYVSLRFVARMQGGGVVKGIYNDGSTGIMAQLQKYSEESGRSGGLVTRNGFRVSEYTYTDQDGNTRPASTWYIAA
jgi:hypothetical protein